MSGNQRADDHLGGGQSGRCGAAESAGDPAVQTLHTTNGRWDIIAELRADTLEAFDRVLGSIRKLEGIANSETSLLLSTLQTVGSLKASPRSPTRWPKP